MTGEDGEIQAPRERPIHLYQHAPGYVRARVGGLSPERYRAYRDAVEGARYVREAKAVVLPMDRVPAVIVRLRDAGFDVEADAVVARTLRERKVSEWLDRKSVQDRIARIDDALHERTGDRMFAYQKTGSLWLARRMGCLLGDDPGCGKTLEIIAALPANAPTLVIGPVVAKGVWRGEIGKWRPQLRSVVIEGRKNFRWPTAGEVVIANYDILPEIHDKDGIAGRKCEGFYPKDRCPGCFVEIRFAGPVAVERVIAGKHREKDKGGCDGGWLPPKRCPGCHPILKEMLEATVLVFDEAHVLKTPTSLRTMRARAMAAAVRHRKGRTWLATGTPLVNQPKDLWHVLACAGVAEDAFGSWQDFKRLFKTAKLPHGGYAQGDISDNEDEIGVRLQRVMLRRRKADVLAELPRKRWQPYPVELDAAALRRVDAMLRATGRSIDSIVEQIDKKVVEFKDMSQVREALAVAKIPAMMEIVEDFEERQEPLVVFSAHRAPIDALRGRAGWGIITGDENANQKRAVEEAFQKGELRGVALTIAAGGVAITLTRALFGLFVDRAWTPPANQQAEDRLNRIGAGVGREVAKGEKLVNVYIDIVSDHPLDKRVTEILVTKAKYISASVDAAATIDDVVSTIDKREREAIAFGRVVRRMPGSEAEEKALEALHTGRFPNLSDDRLAGKLAEEAMAIGLSDAQWKLAVELSGRVDTRPRDEETAAAVESALASEVEDDVDVLEYDVDKRAAGDDSED